jgi:predicted SAM-dependent methyltransferase
MRKLLDKIKRNERRPNIVELLKNYPDRVMLNVGCGTDYKEGWINIDNNTDDNIENLDLNWDLRNPLPFDDNSVDYIFNEHFIEHLTVEEGIHVNQDFLRVLKPGGVLRMATPDLTLAVDKYLNLPIYKDPVVKQFHLDFINTLADRLNMAFSWWGHKWLYDWEELERRLKEAVCKKITQADLRKSKHTELRGLEIRDNSTLIAEVTK